jgi:hypothetical protein
MTLMGSESFMVEQDPEFFTLVEVAKRYRASENTVRYWRHIGYGPKGVKVGARVLYPRTEIARFDRDLLTQSEAV